MPLLALPSGTHIPFMRFRKVAIWSSLVLNVIAVVLFFTLGMNFGIDFRGGTVVELRFHEPKPIAEVRQEVGELGLGEVQIVEFGNSTDIMIRVEQQPGGDDAQQRTALILRELYQDQADFRRVEVVGPRVSGELASAGIIGVVVALVAIMGYIWLRFEWRFSVGAIIATLHDVFMTIGLYSLTQIDFSLTSIAAILTIIGYSLNDTVVVYDRLRENLRRFKKMSMSDLIDLSINEMLSRTVMTSLTTLLALIALFAIGGEVIRSFTLAMIWGIVIGTYSSIFIAAPVLISLNLRPGRSEGSGEAADLPSSAQSMPPAPAPAAAGVSTSVAPTADATTVAARTADATTVAARTAPDRTAADRTAAAQKPAANQPPTSAQPVATSAPAPSEPGSPAHPAGA